MDTHVAIVGGGPGGLFAALALLQADSNLRVKVYERSQQYRTCGAGVSVSANGLKSIRAVSPELHAQFQARAEHFDSMEQLDQHGQKIQGMDGAAAARQANGSQEPEDPGLRSGFFGWSDVQQLIYHALPEGTVHFGHALNDLSQDSDGVILHFSDQPDVRADYVVAADGYFSPVREAVWNDGPPDFKDTIMWRGRLPWEEGLCGPWDAKWGRWFMGGDYVGLMYSLPEMIVGWVMSMPLKQAEKQGVHYNAWETATSKTQRKSSSYHGSQGDESSSSQKRAVQAAGEFVPQLAEWIKHTPPSAVVEHGMFTRSADSIEAFAEEGWGQNRVTFVGDAVHATRPTGQGLNMSFEDGAVLAAHVLEKGLSAATLRDFERERIPRVATIVRQEEARGSTSYGKDAKELMGKDRKFPLEPGQYKQFVADWMPKPIKQPTSREPLTAAEA